jgi:hypothetical protein
MSRKHEDCNYNYAEAMQFAALNKKDNCCCSFPTLIILILVLLQFGRKGHHHVDGFRQIDNGILFIIVLFFLACCNPCKKY